MRYVLTARNSGGRGVMHEDGDTSHRVAGPKVRDVAVSTLLMLVVLFFAEVIVRRIETRVDALERVCHGQCKYGDAACAKRCADAGHCEVE